VNAREQLVLRYLSSTLSNAELAAERYLSIDTIKTRGSFGLDRAGR